MGDTAADPLNTADADGSPLRKQGGGAPLTGTTGMTKSVTHGLRGERVQLPPPTPTSVGTLPSCRAPTHPDAASSAALCMQHCDHVLATSGATLSL